MRQISLREFRTRGEKALGDVPPGETILLSGQKGPAWFLVPVLGDLATEDRELRCALARASLRESWRNAQRTGTDRWTEERINDEISHYRTGSEGQPPE
jgi:antitoxin (DNA-binding transcriptional repressor) of toxin-antitoxin stability system